MQDNIAQGLTLSFVGILIVFVILGLIATVVALIGYLDRDWKAREKRQTVEALEKPQNIDDLTIVLIAASAATIIKGRHRIRSITRVKPGAFGSAWSQQGRSVLLGSHRFSKGNE